MGHTKPAQQYLVADLAFPLGLALLALAFPLAFPLALRVDGDPELEPPGLLEPMLKTPAPAGDVPGDAENGAAAACGDGGEGKACAPDVAVPNGARAAGGTGAAGAARAAGAAGGAGGAGAIQNNGGRW